MPRATHIRIVFTCSHVLLGRTLATLRALNMVPWRVSSGSSQPYCRPCLIIPHALMRDMAISISFLHSIVWSNVLVQGLNKGDVVSLEQNLTCTRFSIHASTRYRYSSWFNSPNSRFWPLTSSAVCPFPGCFTSTASSTTRFMNSSNPRILPSILLPTCSNSQICTVLRC